MRRILAILIVLFLSGQVAAHGANSYAIILRTSSVQPESADPIVNDTLVLYNTVTWNRSAGIDVDGDGVDDHTCEMTARNTSSNLDECQFIFENGTWPPGEYFVTVYQNGSSWGSVLVDLLPDNHTESASPGPYVLLPGNLDNMEDEDASTGMIQIIAAAGMAICLGAYLWLKSRKE